MTAINTRLNRTYKSKYVKKVVPKPDPKVVCTNARQIWEAIVANNGKGKGNALYFANIAHTSFNNDGINAYRKWFFKRTKENAEVVLKLIPIKPNAYVPTFSKNI
jgi:hypothetical protein